MNDGDIANPTDELATLRELESLFFAAPAAIAWVGPDLRWQRVNLFLCSLMGQPERALIGQVAGEGLPGQGGESAQRLLGRVLATGETIVCREVPLAASAESGDVPALRHFDWTYAPARREATTSGVLVFGVEVTPHVQRRARDEEALLAERTAHHTSAAAQSRLRIEAERANATKDEFLATVSHELRTPLTVILGWATTLRRKRPEPDIDRGLELIERSARAQSRLIDDVLDVSLVMNGKLVLALGPVDIGEALHKAIANVRPSAEARGIAITSTIETGSAMTVMADADRVQQILWNILSNAVKFTPKAGAIHVSAVRIGSDVTLEIGDTGEGISHEFLEQVFEPFRQADNSTTRRHGGLGLGLALVRQLVLAHGGVIEAHSTGVGAGAKFILKLPARAITPSLLRPSPTAPRPERASPGQAPRLDGLTLLVVDDEQEARELVGELFEEMGARVYLASSAAEALGLLEETRPDVIVSDIGMPHADGYSFMKDVRAKPVQQGGSTPAIALTAYSRIEDVVRARTAGFQEHLAKPVDPDELAVLVASLGRPRSFPQP